MNRKRSILIIYFILLLIYINCNLIHQEHCKNGEYFDTVQLKCSPCPFNQTSLSGNSYSCTCKSGFSYKYSEGKSNCEKCPANQTTSSIGVCVSCAENQTFNASELQCNKCPKNMIVKDQYLNGSSTKTLMCIKCPDNLIADNYINKCVPCHISFYEASHGFCKCPNATHILVNGICALKSNLASIPERKSSHVVNFKTREHESKLFQQFYKISAYGCNFLRNSTSCQILANLCVLLHYSYENELGVCGYYREAFGVKMIDLPKHVPLLYYDKNSAEKVLTNSSFQAKFSLKNSNIFDISNTILNLSVATYSMEGKLMSWQPINEALSYCPGLFPSGQELDFGSTFHSSCHLSSHFIIHHFNTEFYEVFLHYIVNNDEKIHSVPLLNTELSIEGRKINFGSKKYWQLTKRFFLIDTISGKVTEKDKEMVPKIIRYVESIELFIQLKKDSANGQIYPPYVKINYKEITLEELEKNAGIYFSFKVKYINSSSKALKIIGTANGIICGLSGLLGLLKAWSLSKRCGKIGINITIIFRFICLLCGYTANCLFFITFFICSVWVLIFKNQDVFWIFLPDEFQENIIKKYIISAFSLKIVHVLYTIYNQITVHLFLIDWEQPKIQTTPHSVKSLSGNKDLKRDNKFVSIWRTYFIANEWNELQTHRKVNVPFVLFAMLFYLKVLDYESMSRMTVVNNLPHEKIPFAFISRFALSVVLFMMGSFVQSLFKVVIFERYVENKLQMFVDLCSMANISVLIFKHRLYGFYIHGRSVYGESDLNMRSLYEQLKREEEDLCQRRGLEPSSECQTFEVRVTQKFRSNYDSILETFEGTTQTRSRNKLSRIEHCIEAHERMKKFLTIYLQHGLKGLDYIVKDKFFLENALDLEFQEPKEKSLFFRDQNHSFDKVLMCGKESVFLIFEVIIFTFVDLFATDFILAGIITFLVHRIIKTVRYRGGKRNMIDKTLVDERFLI